MGPISVVQYFLYCQDWIDNALLNLRDDDLMVRIARNFRVFVAQKRRKVMGFPHIVFNLVNTFFLRLISGFVNRLVRQVGKLAAEVFTVVVWCESQVGLVEHVDSERLHWRDQDPHAHVELLTNYDQWLFYVLLDDPCWVLVDHDCFKQVF